GGRPQPLVPHGYVLSRHYHAAGDVWLYRPVRRRLGALCGTGKTAPSDGLVAAGVRPGLDKATATDEWHQLLLCPHRPVALRVAARGRHSVAAGASRPMGRLDP